MAWVGNEVQCTRGRWNDREGARYVVSYRWVRVHSRRRQRAADPRRGQRHVRDQAQDAGHGIGCVVTAEREYTEEAWTYATWTPVAMSVVPFDDEVAPGADDGYTVTLRNPNPVPTTAREFNFLLPTGFTYRAGHHDRRADRRPDRQRALARVERRPRRPGRRRGDVLVRRGDQQRRRRPLRRQRVRAEQQQPGLHRVPGRHGADHGRAAVRRDDLHDQRHRGRRHADRDRRRRRDLRPRRRRRPARPGRGNDVLFGGAGYDRLDGGDGDDTQLGGDGEDILLSGRRAPTSSAAAAGSTPSPTPTGASRCA